MSYDFYRLLHVIAMATMAVSLGGLIMGPSGGLRRLLVALHGTAMLVLLVAGFGLAAKIGIGANFPGWMYAKLVLWLGLGLLVVPVRRMPDLKPMWVGTAVVLIAVASWLALYKPF